MKRLDAANKVTNCLSVGAYTEEYLSQGYTVQIP
jgi:hypothetical protein